MSSYELPNYNYDEISKEINCVRNEQGVGLNTAKAIVHREVLMKSIEEAENIDDLKECLLFMLEHTSIS